MAVVVHWRRREPQRDGPLVAPVEPVVQVVGEHTRFNGEVRNHLVGGRGGVLDGRGVDVQVDEAVALGRRQRVEELDVPEGRRWGATLAAFGVAHRRAPLELVVVEGVDQAVVVVGAERVGLDRVLRVATV